MSYDKKDLINFRLEKAKESLEEAEALAKLEHWNTVANRLYYACFYAVSAYLSSVEIQAITHKGVKSAFHNELIKPGLISETLGKFYNDLFNKRQEADYKDFVKLQKEAIQALMPEAIEFVNAINAIIKFDE